MAQKRPDARARRASGSKPATNDRLRQVVQDQLTQGHSPGQIPNWPERGFPDGLGMRASHETIYRALHVQGRGALRRDLRQRLRAGRALSKPRRPAGGRRGKIPGMANIAERPPQVEDRAVPGHWEGGLICGRADKSAIGALVERSTGFVLLLHRPGGHGAGAVGEAMGERMSQLPEVLRRTLARGQGSGMANHARIAEATQLDTYFADPHSPWQRGSSENNGLLRQCVPEGIDLGVFAAGCLEHVARKPNNRPLTGYVATTLLAGTHNVSGLATLSASLPNWLLVWTSRERKGRCPAARTTR